MKESGSGQGDDTVGRAFPRPPYAIGGAEVRGRKHLRRLERLFEQGHAPVFFITCGVKRKCRVLANNAVAGILIDAWRRSPEISKWMIGRYVVMPSHVHFFAAPCCDSAKELSRFMGDWKRWTGRQMRASCLGTFEWQEEFFEHFMRSSESHNQKWEYVRRNPVRAGLV